MMKDELTDLLVERISPIASEIEKLRQDEAYLPNLLSEGTKEATAVAQDTMRTVREKIGLQSI